MNLGETRTRVDVTGDVIHEKVRKNKETGALSWRMTEVTPKVPVVEGPMDLYRSAQHGIEKAKNDRRKGYDDAALDRVKEIEGMNYWDQYRLNAGDETNALIQGFKGNTGIGTQQNEEDRSSLSSEISEGSNPVAEMFGRGTPYVPGGALVRGIGEGIFQGVKHGGRFIQYLRKAGLMGEESKRLGNARKYSQEDIGQDPYLKNLVTDAVGGTVVGAGEGYLHAGESAEEGAVSGGLGSLVPRLTPGNTKWQRHPGYAKVSKTEPRTRELYDWYEEQGGKVPPGEQTGSLSLQSKEAAFKSDPKFIDTFNLMDEHNASINSQIAFEAAGLNTNLKSVTPEVFNTQTQRLRDDFNRLQSQTTGTIPLDEFEGIRARSNSFLKSDEGNADKKVINALLNKLTTGRTGLNYDPMTGKPYSIRYNGKDYQRLRAEMQEQAVKFYDSKSTKAHAVVKDLMNSLDRSMENAMGKTHGREVVNQWKKKNEQWAMLNLLKENGFDLNGNFDPSKLTNHFKNNDLDRILTGQGNSVSNLHKLARMEELKQKAPGTALTGTNITNKEKSTVHSQLGTGPRSPLGISDKAYANLYQKGYPQTWGVLNPTHAVLKTPDFKFGAKKEGDRYIGGEKVRGGLAPENSIYNVNNYLRASQVGEDVQREMAEKGESIYTWMADAFSESEEEKRERLRKERAAARRN